MPRKPRYFLPGVPLHLVQRGHSREPVFFEAQDYATYAYWLKESCRKYEVSVHAFVLMTNHTHLLITPKYAESVSPFIQFIGRNYVPYLNHKYGRSGSAWEGRFKSSLVQEEAYFLTVMRYIEMNPVRANMVELPGQYRWSSFCHNIGERPISFISPHAIYKALGSDQEERSRAYASLFQGHIDKEDMKRIRSAWQTGTPLGNDRFREKVEARLRCKVGRAKRGRPVRVTTEGKGL